ncbi:MAG TPA: hypothetical protein ENJ56_00835 [Anaerolineae bacterium]|nr:hypothetical protein [Anaerolineae bacterium]
MTLKPTDKLAKALDLHPDVLDYVISLNPHDFARLASPLMRRLMPARITLARLAVMVDLPVTDLIRNIYLAAHLPAPQIDPAQIAPLPANPPQAPAWIAEPIVKIVDLLEADERLDTDPFIPLFPVIKHAKVGEVILLKHKWQPQPLYDVWQKLRIEHYAVQVSAEKWHICLRKTRPSFRPQP